MQKRDRWLFGGILAICAVGILLLNLLTPMLADDYMYAYSFANQERIESVADIFPSLAAHAQVMNGRLTPHFFVQLFTLLPRRVFAVINTFVYLLFTLGLYRLARGSRVYDWKLLAIVQGAVFLLPPAFGQSFLWMAGSVNYLWCDALLVWLLIPYADFLLRGERSPKPILQMLMALGALCFGNMSENVSAAGGAMMGLCVLSLWVRKRRAPVWMLSTLLMTLAGWLLLMLAPANRAHVASASGGFAAITQHLSAALSMWMEHGLWPSVVFIALACLFGRSGDGNRTRFAIGLFICSLLCNFAMAAADYYPQRAFTGTIVLQIAACAMLLPTLAELETRRWIVQTLAVCMLMIAGLNGVVALPNTYNRYRQAQAREQEVLQLRDEGAVDVTTYGIESLSRFDAFYDVHELTDNPDYFPNVYYAKYHGLRSIRIDRME